MGGLARKEKEDKKKRERKEGTEEGRGTQRGGSNIFKVHCERKKKQWSDILYINIYGK